LESIKQMSSVEAYTVNSSSGNSAPAGGRRRGRSGKLRLVTKKAARKHLKKLGMKLRGGGPTEPVVVGAQGVPPTTGGGEMGDEEVGGRRRRRRSGKSTKRRRGRSLGRMFGL
jgi:hypothetical protein